MIQISFTSLSIRLMTGSFDTQNLYDLITNDEFHNGIAIGDVKNFICRHRWYEREMLEDYIYGTDIPISFQISDLLYSYDGYLRVNTNGTVKLKFCLRIPTDDEVEFYRVREVDDIKTPEELINVFINRVFHLIWIVPENEEPYTIEIKDM